MLGIGPPELLVIGPVGLVVLGPDRLPEFVRTTARLLTQVRGMVVNAQSDLREELGTEFANLDVRELDPRAFVRKHLLDGPDGHLPGPAVQKTAVTSESPYDDEAT